MQLRRWQLIDRSDTDDETRTHLHFYHADQNATTILEHNCRCRLSSSVEATQYSQWFIVSCWPGVSHLPCMSSCFQWLLASRSTCFCTFCHFSTSEGTFFFFMDRFPATRDCSKQTTCIRWCSGGEYTEQGKDEMSECSRVVVLAGQRSAKINRLSSMAGSQ